MIRNFLGAAIAMSIFAILTPSFAGTQTVLPSDVEIRKILAERLGENEKDVGIVVGVIDPQGRRIISCGQRNAGDARPLNGDTVFEIASVTKVFTALLLADMVEKNEVALSDPPSKYLTAAAIKLPERNGHLITLLDLATHTSGLPFMPADAPPFNDPTAARYSTGDLKRYLAGYQLTRDIGSEWDYSNIGYWVLSEALAARAGKDIETLIRSRVLAPLKMTDTDFKLSPKMKENLAPGHDSALQPAPAASTIPIYSIMPAGGGLYSTANNLLTFLSQCLGYEPSPLAPESDEEKPVEEKKSADKKEEEKPDTAKDKPPEKVLDKIDFDNIGQRILALSLPMRRYVGLQVGKSGELYSLEAPAPSPGQEFSLTVHRFDLKKRKADVALSGVRFFEISQNGEKMLYRQGDHWFIKAPKPMSSDGPGPQPPGGDASEGLLKTDGLEVRVKPREEWKQMYHEVWRVERDFFYDPGYHGLDLTAAEKKYAPYLASIGSRQDLNYLFAEMLGELTVGHLFIFGGDSPEVKHVQTGLLGADYRIENGRYRFARVYTGENWNTDLKAPLTQPGVNVVAGEYLLAVNGRPILGTDDIYSFFEETAGKQVVLKVGSDPTGANSREVTVVPVSSETRLRNLAWIEDNRRKVDQMTEGRVAYVYMPDTGFGGYTNFTRYFFAQVGKEAVIVDERFNGGGALATDIIEILQRRLLSLVATRDGEDEDQPQGAIFGPKVMIINEFAGSGGDAMPWYFRRAGVGKLIGKRTWGGLVGRAAAPELMDGGFVSAPSSGVWNPNGQWEVENHGIAPDIEAELDPELTLKGRDPQLEKAVQVVMEELKQNPLPHPHRPAYPNYHSKEADPR